MTGCYHEHCSNIGTIDNIVIGQPSSSTVDFQSPPVPPILPTQPDVLINKTNASASIVSIFTMFLNVHWECGSEMNTYKVVKFAKSANKCRKDQCTFN